MSKGFFFIIRGDERFRIFEIHNPSITDELIGEVFQEIDNHRFGGVTISWRGKSFSNTETYKQFMESMEVLKKVRDKWMEDKGKVFSSIDGTIGLDL